MTELPHEILDGYLAYHVGRRANLYGSFFDTLWEPVVRAISDELSMYQELFPFAVFRIGEAYIKEGMERSYIFVKVQDRGHRLNMLGAMEHWDCEVPNRPEDFVTLINGRRWHFAEKNLGQVMLPLLTKVADALGEYCRRKPFVKKKAGLIRWIEGIDASWLVVEVDDRSQESHIGEMRSRYLIQ